MSTRCSGLGAYDELNGHTTYEGQRIIQYQVHRCDQPLDTILRIPVTA